MPPDTRVGSGPVAVQLARPIAGAAVEPAVQRTRGIGGVGQCRQVIRSVVGLDLVYNGFVFRQVLPAAVDARIDHPVFTAPCPTTKKNCNSRST